MIACRACGAPTLSTFLDLGSTPLANSYVDPSEVITEPTYPLHAMVCETCFLVQLDHDVSPEQIFSEYAYFSSISESWLSHARRFAHEAVTKRSLNENSLVIEIASNDGYLLRSFAEIGIPTLGVEPAKNVAVVAQQMGLETVVDFFDAELADQIVQEKRRADLIVANNVVAHVPELNGFMEGIRRILDPGGALSIEVPHLLRLIERVAFDTIYHEHFSYFSLIALERVLHRHDLCVYDVEELGTHGGSLRIWAEHRAQTSGPSDRVNNVRRAEKDAGLDTIDPYKRFSDRVRSCRTEFLSFLSASKAAGRSIAAYGAAAKGNTFLNYCGLTSNDIDYVVDRSPHKQGLLLPGSRIPIKDPSEIEKTKPDLLLILPWNLKNEIIEQMAGVRAWGGRFVLALPTIEII